MKRVRGYGKFEKETEELNIESMVCLGDPLVVRKQNDVNIAVIMEIYENAKKSIL